MFSKKRYALCTNSTTARDEFFCIADIYHDATHNCPEAVGHCPLVLSLWVIVTRGRYSTFNDPEEPPSLTWVLFLPPGIGSRPSRLGIPVLQEPNKVNGRILTCNCSPPRGYWDERRSRHIKINWWSKLIGCWMFRDAMAQPPKWLWDSSRRRQRDLP